MCHTIETCFEYSQLIGPLKNKTNTTKALRSGWKYCKRLEESFHPSKIILLSGCCQAEVLFLAVRECQLPPGVSLGVYKPDGIVRSTILNRTAHNISHSFHPPTLYYPRAHPRRIKGGNRGQRRGWRKRRVRSLCGRTRHPLRQTSFFLHSFLQTPTWLMGPVCSWQFYPFFFIIVPTRTLKYAKLCSRVNRPGLERVNFRIFYSLV